MNPRVPTPDHVRGRTLALDDELAIGASARAVWARSGVAVAYALAWWAWSARGLRASPIEANV